VEKGSRVIFVLFLFLLCASPVPMSDQLEDGLDQGEGGEGIAAIPPLSVCCYFVTFDRIVDRRSRIGAKGETGSSLFLSPPLSSSHLLILSLTFTAFGGADRRLCRGGCASLFFLLPLPPPLFFFYISSANRRDNDLFPSFFLLFFSPFSSVPFIARISK